MTSETVLRKKNNYYDHESDRNHEYAYEYSWACTYTQETNMISTIITYTY